jgi:hypothetical protein
MASGSDSTSPPALSAAGTSPCGDPGLRHWLGAYTWADVLRTVAHFWHLPAENIEAASAYDTRELWDREAPRSQSLPDALRLCRRCQIARPFGRYDCDSFVLIARDAVKPFLAGMSATLATAVVAIIGDYVRGSCNELEMHQAADIIVNRYPAAPGASSSPAGL